VASNAATTITVNGTATLAQLKFDATGSVIIAGVAYTYTGIAGSGGLQFTGLSGVPALTVGAPIYQQPVAYTFSSATFTNSITPPTGFTCDLIGVLSTNQVMIASIVNNLVYLSKAGTYKDYSQSSPRVQNDGFAIALNGNITSLQPQEDKMYVSSGLDNWFVTNFATTTTTNSTTGTTVVYETAKFDQLKTTAGQAAISQYATTKIANDVAMITNEPRVDSLGRVSQQFLTAQITNLSYPIIYDMNSYNFTDASLFYFKERLYVAVPASGIVIIYNMTNPKSPFWEAPQNLPISGFCAVGNVLIGHSSATFESYVMFTGYSDRAADANSTGNPISSVALFAFQELGLRFKTKSFNKFAVEGYISEPTTLTVGLIYRSPGNGLTAGQTLTILGTDTFVLNGISDNSLGKLALGKDPLGEDMPVPQQVNLPPYFAVIKTFTRNPYLAYQPMFSSLGTNQRWELLCYGANAAPTSEGENDITR
jgi:hypothetical protein